MKLVELITKWYTLGIHDRAGHLWLPIPGYDGRTIVAYGRGEDVAELYTQLLSHSAAENAGCLKDGKPCAPDGEGDCVACDDGLGNYSARMCGCGYVHKASERCGPW